MPLVDYSRDWLISKPWLYPWIKFKKKLLPVLAGPHIATTFTNFSRGKKAKNDIASELKLN